MLVPSTVVKDVEPPSGGGARNHHAEPRTATVARALTTVRTYGASLRDRIGGAAWIRAADSLTVGETTVAITTSLLRRP